MAESNSTDKTQTSTFAHTYFDGWERFEGTKSEIQKAGFGIGKLFPGEPGANKRKLSLGRVNGFARASIERMRTFDRDTGAWVYLDRFEVDAPYIDFKLPDYRTKKADFAPGVTRHEVTRGDVYIGSPDALIQAGLVLPEQLPGTANTGKVRTTFLPDGTRVKQGDSRHSGTAGTKTIVKFGRRIKVVILVDDAVNEERHAEWIKRCDDARLHYDRALAERASSIMIAKGATKPKDTSHLRLVWSA